MQILSVVSVGILLVIWIFFGTVVGSYVHTIRWRLKAGEEVPNTPSHCGSCGHTLRVVDVVPVYSYLRNKGKCRYCSAAIEPSILRYELMGGLVALATGLFIPVWTMGIVIFISFLVTRFYLKIR